MFMLEELRLRGVRKRKADSWFAHARSVSKSAPSFDVGNGNGENETSIAAHLSMMYVLCHGKGCWQQPTHSLHRCTDACPQSTTPGGKILT